MAIILQESGSNQLVPSVAFSPMIGDGGGAVSANGGCGGDDDPFDIVGGKVVRCELVFGRAALTCDDAELEALAPGTPPQGVIYASVAHAGSSAPELSVLHGDELPECGLDVTNRALYRAEGGAWRDVRRAITVVAMSP